jgi:hypothetical protein
MQAIISTHICVVFERKSKAVPLHAIEALGGEEV